MAIVSNPSFVLQNFPALAADPTSGMIAGDTYRNSVSGQLRTYDGTCWSDSVDNSAFLDALSANDTGMLPAMLNQYLYTFGNWCAARGVKGYLGEFAIPVIPTAFGGAYAFADRARWESLMETMLAQCDLYGMHATYWDVNERSSTGSPGLCPYVRSASGDYRDTLADGAPNCLTPSGVVLERHLKLPSTLRGVNYSMGTYGKPYNYGNSSFFSNTRDATAFHLDPNIDAATYNYGGADTYAYLASRGVKLVRLAFNFERLFRGSTPTLHVIDTTELNRIKDALTAAGNNGIQVLLANHGQAFFLIDDGSQGVPKPVGDAAYTTAMYGTMWGVIATALAGHSGLGGYALDNEPGGGGNPMLPATWDTAAQAAVTAIRAHDTASLISVPLYQASVSAPEMAGTGFITDPNSNFVYEVHLYPDGAGSFPTSYLTTEANLLASDTSFQKYTIPNALYNAQAGKITLANSSISGFFARDRDDATWHSKLSAFYRNGGKLNLWSEELGDVLSVDAATGVVTLHDGFVLGPLMVTTTQAANYVLVAGDSGTTVEGTKATAQTVTVPPNSSVAFPIGTVIAVCQAAAGQITITPGSGVTLDSASSLKTRAQWSEVGLRKRGTNEWVVTGDLA